MSEYKEEGIISQFTKCSRYKERWTAPKQTGEIDSLSHVKSRFPCWRLIIFLYLTNHTTCNKNRSKCVAPTVHRMTPAPRQSPGARRCGWERAPREDIAGVVGRRKNLMSTPISKLGYTEVYSFRCPSCSPPPRFLGQTAFMLVCCLCDCSAQIRYGIHI